MGWVLRYPYPHPYPLNFVGNYPYPCPCPKCGFLPYPLWVFFAGTHWVWVNCHSYTGARARQSALFIAGQTGTCVIRIFYYDS